MMMMMMKMVFKMKVKKTIYTKKLFTTAKWHFIIIMFLCIGQFLVKIQNLIEIRILFFSLFSLLMDDHYYQILLDGNKNFFLFIFFHIIFIFVCFVHRWWCGVGGHFRFVTFFDFRYNVFFSSSSIEFWFFLDFILKNRIN